LDDESFASSTDENYMCSLHAIQQQQQLLLLHRVSKKTSKIIFVITTSNFHQIWQFLAQRWRIKIR